MGKSVRHTIYDAIVAQLATIRKVNGYNLEVQEENIYRGTLFVVDRNVFPTLLLSVSDVVTSELTGIVNRRMSVEITLALGGEISILPESVEYGITDIQTAMAQDRTLGGLICDSSLAEIREPSFSQRLEGHSFVSLVFDLDYRASL